MKQARDQGDYRTVTPAVPHPALMSENSKQVDVLTSNFLWAFALKEDVKMRLVEKKLEEAGELIKKYVR